MVFVSFINHFHLFDFNVTPKGGKQIVYMMCTEFKVPGEKAQSRTESPSSSRVLTFISSILSQLILRLGLTVTQNHYKPL